jgi:hypothetical protein
VTHAAEASTSSSQANRQPSMSVVDGDGQAASELTNAFTDVTVSSPTSIANPQLPPTASGTATNGNGEATRRQSSSDEPQTSGLLALAHWIGKKDDKAQSVRSNAIKLVEVVLGGTTDSEEREQIKAVLAEPLRLVGDGEAERALALVNG